MPTTRIRAVAILCIAIAPFVSAQPNTTIDRHALVTCRNIEVHAIDPNGAMAVGNGSFAFNLSSA